MKDAAIASCLLSAAGRPRGAVFAAAPAAAAARRRDGGGLSLTSAAEGLAAAHQPAGRPPGGVGEFLGVRPAGISTGRTCPPSRQPCQRKRPQRDFLLHGLVPAQPARGADGELVHGTEPAAVVRFFGGAGLKLQEAQVDLQLRLRPRAQQAVGEHGRLFPGAGLRGAGRAQDAELPAGLVLLRRRPVGVQQVALVEDGVRDGAGKAQAHVHRSRSPAHVGGCAGQQRLHGSFP